MSDVGIDDGDGDSLFGSPPPSPQLSPIDAPEPVHSPDTDPVLAPAPEVRGRLSSLALPCSSHDTGTGGVGIFLPNKNVGTIALPGSQVGAESIVVLPASPPRSAQISAASSSQAGHARPHLAQVKTNTPTGTSSSKGKQSSQKKRRERAVNQVVESPVFTLPTDSEPPPANFLRNQQALLGLAGVIAGLNPARLSTCNAKGTTAQNPIVIGDSTSHRSRQSRVDRCQLPIPSGNEIASILLKQKEILPLLKSLLPFLSGKHTDTSYGTLSTTRTYSVPLPERDEHAAKRRKIEMERERWEKEREKKLLMQLVRIVKDAVQKAASRMNGSLQSSEATNVSLTQVHGGYSEMPEDANMSPSQAGSTPTSNQTNALTVPLSSSQSHSSSADVVNSQFCSFDPIGGSDLGGTSLSNLEDDLKIWLESLGSVSFQDTPDNSRPQTRSSSFSMTETNSPTLSSYSRLPTPVDISLLGICPDKENSAPTLFPGSETNEVDVRVADDFDFGNFNFDIPIDPVLLDLCEKAQPSTSASPTPVERTSAPIVSECSPSASSSKTAAQNSPASMSPQPSPVPPPAPIILPPPPPRPITVITPSPSLQPSMRAATASLQPPIGRTGPILIGASLYEEQAMPFINFFPPPSARKTVDIPSTLQPASTTTRQQPTNQPKFSKSLDRQAILKRARARREQLAAEIARAKVELWETTIEQGVLVHLSKDKSLA